jgi:hypothetical protein
VRDQAFKAMNSFINKIQEFAEKMVSRVIFDWHTSHSINLRIIISLIQLSNLLVPLILKKQQQFRVLEWLEFWAVPQKVLQDGPFHLSNPG